VSEWVTKETGMLHIHTHTCIHIHNQKVYTTPRIQTGSGRKTTLVFFDAVEMPMLTEIVEVSPLVLRLILVPLPPLTLVYTLMCTLTLMLLPIHTHTL
jgi:hypothetical protein